MQAHEGDWLVVHSHTDGGHIRRAEIIGTRDDGAPPYSVRWIDDDKESVVFPGPDAQVVSAGPALTSPVATAVAGTNLCADPTFTGWDVDGGYADCCVADGQFAYRMPDGVSDEHASPLLCAGIIGYRSLKAAAVPVGGRLGIYGFGGSGISPPSLLFRWVCGCMSSLAANTTGNWPPNSASTRSAAPSTPRRNHWTAPFSPRLPVIWSPWRCARRTPERLWLSPASGCPTSPS